MRNFLILAAVASMAVLCVAWQVSNTTTFDNVVVRTNLTLGGVARSTWPAGTGDVLAGNALANQMPLLGAGGVTVFATNTAGFRAAVGLVIGTDVQAFSSTLADWALLSTNSMAPLESPTFTGTATFDTISATTVEADTWNVTALAAGSAQFTNGVTNIALTDSRVMMTSATKVEQSVSHTGIVKGDGTEATANTDYLSVSAPAMTGTGTTTGNLGPLLSVGDVTFVDVTKASQTNSVSGALAFAHATNGVHGTELTHVSWLFNGSGSDQTLTIPSGWRTNVYSAVPPALTNSTITRMVLTCIGPTADATSQTNVYVAFEYYK